jgi:hypothetical protein
MSWQPDPHWRDPQQAGVPSGDPGAGYDDRYAQPYGQGASRFGGTGQVYGTAPASGGYAQPGYGQAQPGYGQAGGTFGQQAYGQAYAVPHAYSAPAGGTWPGTRVVQHRPWSTSMVWLTSLSTAVGALALLAGILTTFAAPGAAFGDGPQTLVAAMVGPVLVLAGGVALVVSLTMLIMTVLGRRRADQGTPGLLQAAGWFAAVVSGLSILSTIWSLVNGDGFSGGFASVLLLVAGIKVIAATRA